MPAWTKILLAPLLLAPLLAAPSAHPADSSSAPQAAPRDLGTLGGGWSRAFGVNGRGWVVGASQVDPGRLHATSGHAPPLPQIQTHPHTPCAAPRPASLLG